MISSSIAVSLLAGALAEFVLWRQDLPRATRLVLLVVAIFALFLALQQGLSWP